jgi:hypothetical protein
MSNKIYESKTIIITIFHNNFHNTTPTNNKIHQTTNKTMFWKLHTNKQNQAHPPPCSR